MNKKRVLWIIVDLVFIIVFNLAFYVVGGIIHEASVWISYSFIHFAYLMLIITPFLVKKSNNTAVLGFPLYSISTTYFLVEFIVGLIFIFVHPQSFKVSLLIQLIIASVYAIMLISHMIANEHTAEKIELHEMELRYVKDASAYLKGIMNSVSDKTLRKKIEGLYDLVHSSPAKSNNSVRDYELKVLNLIDVLDNNISCNDFSAAEDTINMIEKNASERNRQLIYK